MENKCGSCRLCCKVLGVPEINKMACQKCAHAGPLGCGIYESRPQSCRDFNCLWLISQDSQHKMLPALKPDACGVVLGVTVPKDDQPQRLVAYVDPDKNEPHKNGAMGRFLSRMVRAGSEVIVVKKNERTLMTTGE